MDELKKLLKKAIERQKKDEKENIKATLQYLKEGNIENAELRSWFASRNKLTIAIFEDVLETIEKK
jgi:hypothetical protein